MEAVPHFENKMMKKKQLIKIKKLQAKIKSQGCRGNLITKFKCWKKCENVHSICFLPEKGQKLNNKVQTCRDLNLSKFQWSYLQISLVKSRIVNDTGN